MGGKSASKWGRFPIAGALQRQKMVPNRNIEHLCAIGILKRKRLLKQIVNLPAVSGDDVCRAYLVPDPNLAFKIPRFGRLFSNLAIAGSTFWHDAAVDIWCMCADVSIVSSENSVWVFMHVFLVSLHVQFPSIQDYVKNPLLENIHFWGS